MKLRHFLDAAYAILHEEYQRYKLNLFDASEQLREFAAGYKPVVKDGQPVPASEDQEVRAIARAMSELNSQLKDTGLVFP